MFRFASSWVRACALLPSIVLAVAVTGCGGRSSATPPVGSLSAQRIAVPNSFRVVYTFGNLPDAESPEAPLVNVSGTLYGTTVGGGSAGAHGTVFSVTPAGVEKVIYSFGSKNPDGEAPEAPLVNVNGTLYGTTTSGNSDSCGSVFSVTPAGVEKVLYLFKNSPDGCGPFAPVMNVKGVLYGTTKMGGKSAGNGAIFRVSTVGVEKVLHAFSGGATDGAQPFAGLLNVGGTFYGTTYFGGTNNVGTVFKRTSAGVVSVLHSFVGTDGAYPQGGLINVGGTLYGTTSNGGYGYGTVYSITTAGVENVVYKFLGSPDGSTPNGNLIAVKGTLYGTTTGGGTTSFGTVYKVTTAGVETVLHSFGESGDGADPLAGLINVGGTLFGTTESGGSGFNGTVFAIQP